MITQSNHNLVATYKASSRLASAIVAAIGCAVLVGWMLDIAVLKSVFPGLATMKANTALGFILSGLSLWLLHTESTAPRTRRIAQACAVIVSLLGLLTLGEYIFGWDLGIDQLLFKDLRGAVGTLSPGRMAPNTALNFLLVGCALLLLDYESHRGNRPAQFLALGAALVALLALVGYVYYGATTYGLASYTQMALHTAAAFFVLGLAILFARPDRGLMRIASSDSAGGIITRRLVPAMIITPTVLGWLRLQGERVGLFETEFGLSLFALSNIAILTILIVWNAGLLHRADNERQRVEHALRASQAMFQGFFNFAPDAIIAVNREGRIVRVNARAEAMFGYHREELLGQAIEVLLPERFTQRHTEHRAGYVAEPHPRAMGTGLELYSRRKDGSEFAVDITLGPLNTDGGLVVMSIVRDVTERKQAEAALARYAQDLARSNAELEQFAYVASHDLQEPLRAVTGMVQLLRQRYQGQLDARADEFITHAVDGATRMQALISDLLTYSRVGTRGKPFAPTGCSAILEDALANLAVALRESGATVTHDTLPVVTADATQMTQLFQNLIGNALKFRGEHPPEVHVGAEQREGEWQFSVRDNGIGIEPQYLERIFGVFQRLHTRREYPGTGIGLAICKKIVERHGGRIWIESEPGQGSTFYFTLPDRR